MTQPNGMNHPDHVCGLPCYVECELTDVAWCWYDANGDGWFSNADPADEGPEAPAPAFLAEVTL